MNDRERAPSKSFKRRIGFVVVLVTAVLAVLGLLVMTIQVVLLTFAGILGGILLSALTSLLTRYLPKLPRPVALGIVVVVLLGVSTGVGALVGPALYDQFVQLSRELPPAVRSLSDQLESSRVAQELLSQLPEPQELLSSSSLASQVATVFTSVGGAAVSALFILVTSLFFAVCPDKYVGPLVRLVPPPRRDRARRLLDDIGSNLRAWIVARFVSMLAVGVLTGLGLWIVGIPAWASLGLLAGLLSFIPNLGPILSALPGILLGLSQGPMTALWAALVYIVVQIIEGNVITPFAEQRAVSIPPAYLLAVQLLMGLTTGILGLMVATPVLVVAVLVVRGLYVERIERSGDSASTEGLVLPAGVERSSASSSAVLASADA